MLTLVYFVCRLFHHFEGSIISLVGQDDNLNSLAAVLANICHEYSEFGLAALDENRLQSLIIQHDNAMYVTKPIYGLILCFVCAKDANLGLISNKIKIMSETLEREMQGLAYYLKPQVRQN